MWKLALALSVCLPLAAAQTPPAPDATTGKAAPNVTVTEARPHINYQDSKAERKGPDKIEDAKMAGHYVRTAITNILLLRGSLVLVRWCACWVREGGRLSSIIKTKV